MSDRETLASELRQMIEHIRAHVPDAVVNTRLAHSDQNGVVIHAQIMGGSGPSGSAHASAPVGDASPELAENRAIARAMIAMGLPAIQDTAAPKLHSVAQQDQPSRVVQFPAQEPERADNKPSRTRTRNRLRSETRRHLLDRVLDLGKGQRLRQQRSARGSDRPVDQPALSQAKSANSPKPSSTPGKVGATPRYLHRCQAAGLASPRSTIRPQSAAPITPAS